MTVKKTDSEKKVDKYIKDAPEYARPIMEKIRKAVHKGCPQAEDIALEVPKQKTKIIRQK